MKPKNNKYSIKLQGVTLFAVVFLFLANTSNAQLGWKKQAGDTSYSYNSIYFSDWQTGWVAGSNGKIFKTTNGGASWFAQLTNSYQNNLQKIQFVNGQTGYACGSVTNSYPNSGVILETENGGYIWTNVTRNFMSFKNLYFFNAYIGFVVGGRHADSSNTGTIWRTTNGGTGAGNTNFTEVLRVQKGMIRTISFINTNTGWVSATDLNNNTTIMKSTNYGSYWDTTVCTLNGIYINDMKFLNANTGIAVGGAVGGSQAKILKTTNGGVSWTQQTFSGANHFNGMSWVQITGNLWKGWVCGENGLIYVTFDMGNTWIPQLTPTIANLSSICFYDLNIGWSSGNSANIITTANGGVLVSNISTEIPNGYKIYQNYPNPFNPTTTIKFDILKNEFIKLEIFDQTGRKVDDLVNENLKAGSYSVTWNAANKPSGIYYYKLTTSEFTKTMKMSLVK